MTEKEKQIQEALGIARRYEVIIYHDVTVSLLYQRGDRIIYNTIIVFAKKLEDACRFISYKYKVKNMIDCGVDAKEYVGDEQCKYCIL